MEINWHKDVTHNISLPIVGVNLIIPPLMMFLIVASIKPPRQENASRVILESIKILKASEIPAVHKVKKTRKRSVILNAILTFAYFVVSGLVFGLMIYGLLKIHFSPLSIAIFFIFFCLI